MEREPWVNDSARFSRRVFAGLLVLTVAFFAVPRARAQSYEQLWIFGTPPDPRKPDQPLIRASDGNIYGVTRFGGDPNGDPDYPLGAVFRLDANDNVTFLHHFSVSEGIAPSALLEFGGYLYGMAQNGGANDRGTIFRLDFLGNLTKIHDFSGPDGEAPFFPLIPSSGWLYGTTTSGGANGCGTAFRISPTGTLVTLHHFVLSEGCAPASPLLLASDGNFYGVADGGRFLNGVLYRMDASGNETIVHSFSYFVDGSQPYGAVIESSGFIYGTTLVGGQGEGTVYRSDFSGTFSSLHFFSGNPDGDEPEAGLVRVGNYFYGTTVFGGNVDGLSGTLFRMDSSGNMTILWNFGDIAADGQGPSAELLPVSNSLYGTTFCGPFGAIHCSGTVFRWSGPLAVHKLLPKAGPVFVAPGVPVQIRGGVFPVGGAPPPVKFGGLHATNVVVVDPQTIELLTPVDLSPGALYDVTVTAEDGTETTLERAWLGDFLDVPTEDPNHDYVERVFRARIMDGCGDGNFCQSGTVNRGDFTMIALKAKHGPVWVPPSCTGQFRDVACPGPQADWIEEAVAEGVIDTCNPHKFCPTRALTKETLPAAMLKTEHGSDYEPLGCTGIFGDVECPSRYADAIEQLYNEGVTESCSTDPLLYCPKSRLTRGPMAESAAKGFRLP
jgi:uncharacterized repeat protein (TIGR03803 family)